MEYFLGAFKKYADFTGRARRKEYWMFFLFYMIFYLAASVIDALIGSMIISSICGLYEHKTHIYIEQLKIWEASECLLVGSRALGRRN